MPESVYLWGGVAGYVAGMLAALVSAASTLRGPRTSWVQAALVLGVVLLAAAIAERWLRLGQGPFLTLFEVLLSNTFSLGLIYCLVFWRIPATRPAAIAVLPVLVLLGLWTMVTSTEPRALPATYANPWLWVHVIAGKLFLGILLVSAGSSIALLLGRVADSQRELVDAVTWQLLAIAFVFQSLMLVAGAAWARDAWGRYWAWDPLETWSFISWLAVGLCLHLRSGFRVPGWVFWTGVVAVFVLAVINFLGVPFLSVAAHKGVM